MKKYIVLIVITIMFTGCLSEYNTSHLKEKRKNVEAYSKKIKKQIEKRLNLEKEEFVYESDDLVDPFKSIFMKSSGLSTTLSSGITPSNPGTITELQRFELEDFKLVGVVYGTILNDRRGLLKDPTGKTHIIREGELLGKNFGRVSSIKKDRIEIREITYDAHGGQKARKIKIDLEEE